MKKYLLALDQGTSSCRTVVFNTEGAVVGFAQRPIKQSYPQPGWVEHDPLEILNTQIQTMREALVHAEITPEQIAGLGITNQRETLVVWDKDSAKPVYPAIVWQCRRTAPICRRLKEQGLEPLIRAKTGLPIDAYFSATKLIWLLENIPGLSERVRQGKVLAGTIDSWLIWNLTAGQCHVTDATNASRTMLYNLKTGQWDDELLELLAIPRQMLPDLSPSVAHFGTVSEQVFPGKIPIYAVLGDQQAALFGQACFNAGMTKNTYGTGCFILMNTGKDLLFSKHGLLTTVAWDLGRGLTYALEGSVFNAGSALQWLKEELHLFTQYDQCDSLAESVPDSNGVCFVPAFTGLGAPHWDMAARGLVAGLTLGSSKAHIVRAALEAIGQQCADVLESMVQDTRQPVAVLRVDGGISVSDWTMQYQADIAALQVERSQQKEMTAWGAASLAGIGCGIWQDESALVDCRLAGQHFSPTMTQAKRTSERARWARAVRTASCFAEKKE